MFSHEHRRVWYADKDEAWVEALVLDEGLGNPTTRILTVRGENSTEPIQIEVDVATGEGDFIKSRNFFEEDTDVCGYEDVHDLTHLTHLHEAEILEALCVRFRKDLIYTYTGPILLAVNPFKELKIYSEDTLGTYYSTGILKSQNLLSEAPALPPHVFAIADAAYRNMMETDKQGASRGKGVTVDQSILISGESGAGKTESTKYVMRYLATVARSEDADPMEKGRAERVLESNPILESFGNARTNRNDNSSRFGKFIQMSFDSKGFLIGAQIATYLLEKVRLAQQAKGERNFHVFYQMCAGANDEEREAWMLPDLEQSHYTNQSQVYERRDGVMDADQFARTDEAMKKMKFSLEERDSIYRIASAVLNLGNVDFAVDASASKDGEAARVAEPEALTRVANLLKVDETLLIKALTSRKIITGNETFVKPLDVLASNAVRDALAKTVYSRMFDWIVKRVNIAISTDDGVAVVAPVTATKRPAVAAPVPAGAFIGVLDIFGFEVFETNSFEQLCINYANESLQQHFNEFVFSIEQKLYESERIQWAFIDFPDNKPVLDLIEAKQPKPGILALLDEQCLFPQGNDKAFANKLYDSLGGGLMGSSVPKSTPSKPPGGGAGVNPTTPPATPASALNSSAMNMGVVGSPTQSNATSLLFASSADKVKSNFCVRHYAGTVTYSSLGFCVKNKDELREEALEVMRTSSNTVVITLFPETASSQKEKGNSIQSQTVGSQFKGQLASLLKTVKSTEPHFIRCLKPNDQNVRDTLLRPRVVDQLRYGGVLEAVKVARAGYPTRFTLRDFVRKYFMLSSNLKLALSKRSQTFAADDEKWVESCEAIFQGPLQMEKGSQYQIGRTKVFMRKSAFEKLEVARGKIFKQRAADVQRFARGFLARRRFVEMKKAASLLTRMVRGFTARRRARAIRRSNAAIKIQSIARMFLARKFFQRQVSGALAMQSLVRGRVGRKKFASFKIFVMARKVQCAFRARRDLRRFIALVGSAVVLQTRFRGYSARQELKQLRMEQKQVGYLNNKIAELQKRVVELENELKQERAMKKNGVVEAVAVVKSSESAVVVDVEERAPPNRREEEEPERKRTQPPVVDESAALVTAAIVTADLHARLNTLAEARAKDAEALRVALTERDQAREASKSASPMIVSAGGNSDAGAASKALFVFQQKYDELAGSHASVVVERDRLLEQVDPDELLREIASERDVLKDRFEIISKELVNVTQQFDKALISFAGAEKEKDHISKERDSLRSLVMASGGDGQAHAAAEYEKQMIQQATQLEATLVKVTQERDRLAQTLSEERGRVDRAVTVATAVEKAAAVPSSSSLVGASDDERVVLLMEREKELVKDRGRLVQNLQDVIKERDSLSAMVTATTPEEAQAQREKFHAAEIQTIKSLVTQLTLEKQEAERERQLLIEREVETSRLAKSLENGLVELKIRNDELMVTKVALQERLDEQMTALEQRQKAGLGGDYVVVDSPASKAANKSMFSRFTGGTPGLTLPPAVATNGISSPSSSASLYPTRTEILATKLVELEKQKIELVTERKAHIDNLMALKEENDSIKKMLHKVELENDDVRDKLQALGALAEQNSNIKIKLARRVEDLLQDNKALKQTTDEYKDQVAALEQVKHVLNDELVQNRAALRGMGGNAATAPIASKSLESNGDDRVRVESQGSDVEI